MVECRGKMCAGARIADRIFRPEPCRTLAGRDEPAAASAVLLAGFPYFPYRVDTPEPFTLVLLGAAFLPLAWRICRRS